MRPPKHVPGREWVLTDTPSAVKALAGMMGKRGLILESLAAKMNGRQLFSKFLRGEQRNIHLQSMIDAAMAMGFEVVIREPEENMTRRRIAALAQERRGHDEVKIVEEAAKDLVAQEQGLDGRDDGGILTRPLTEAEKVEVEKLLERYSDL